MKISFLGTGAAEGVPAVFCDCAFCNAVRKAGAYEVRTRSQVCINDDLLIDYPPDANYHSFADGINLSKIKYLLVTHSHMDHFYAHDFILRGYKYALLKEPLLTIYGNAEVSKVFCECTAREMKPDVAGHIMFKQIEPLTAFNAGSYKVLALPAEHTKTEDALLFYVELFGRGYLHLHDTGNLGDNAISFLAQHGAKAAAVAYDCTFGSKSGNLTARHMGIPDVITVRNRLLKAGIIDGETINILTHFSHNCSPFRNKMSEQAQAFGFVAAHDGYTIEI